MMYNLTREEMKDEYTKYGGEEPSETSLNLFMIVQACEQAAYERGYNAARKELTA